MKPPVAVCLCVALLGACGTGQDASDWEPKIRAANDVLLNQGDVATVPAFFTGTYVAHGTDGQSTDRDAVADFVSELRAAFPDLRVEIQVLATEGDRVAWQRTSRGTHQGDFMGVPASGRPLVWQEIIVSRYDGNLIAEEWGVSDLGAQLRAP